MDYGYQLLRHVVQQVFGNLGAALRITAALVLIPSAILFASNPEVIVASLQPADPFASPAGQAFPSINGLGLIVGLLAAIVGWLWAAVAWHRFVLLEEYPTGALPAWRGSQIVNYFGNSLLILLVLFGVVLGLALGIALVTAIVQSVAVALLLAVGLAIGASWVALRIGLILPAAAIGARLGLGESWRATAPVSGQLLLPVIVLALVFGLINQAVALAFGPTLLAAAIGVAVYWVQLLLNLALMTTLYGNLIEGRQLN